MLGFLLDALSAFWNSILAMFGFGSSQTSITNQLEVFVKSNKGEQVCLQLDPSWTVADVKKTLAPKFNSSPEDLKIIFAGKELSNEMEIRQCDLGNRSLLHAVIVKVKEKEAMNNEQRNLTATVNINSLQNDIEEVKETDATHNKQATTSDVSTVISDRKKHKDETSINTDSLEAASSSCPPVDPAIAGSSGDNRCARLLCDASTVMTIQLTEDEQKHIMDLKASGKEGETPHFYVYCMRPCGSVRVGKLRVRCSLCKQGAITLHRDPCNWQDVLSPGQIDATCETEGCEGNMAQFFFKCREHLTLGEDDTAVALYLIRANLQEIPCLACMDVSTPVIVFQCQAAHVICLDCFVTYCISRLSERQFVQDNTVGYTLPCPAGCEKSFIEEVHHFKLMGEAHYDRYQRWGTEEAVLSVGGVLCPYPGCGQGIIPDQDCRRVACLNGCGFVFCRLCLQGYHIGECNPSEGQYPNDPESSGSFSIDPSRAAHARWGNENVVAIKTLTKPCPACRTPTERDGGCMHMICTRGSCGFGWCWVCQTEWTRECMAAHWFG